MINAVWRVVQTDCAERFIGHPLLLGMTGEVRHRNSAGIRSIGASNMSISTSVRATVRSPLDLPCVSHEVGMVRATGGRAAGNQPWRGLAIPA
jgi:hypothetical protein